MSFCVRFYQNEKKKKNHFAMIVGILNRISFCVNSMRYLNEKLYFALKDGTPFKSSRKHLRPKVTANLHLDPPTDRPKPICSPTPAQLLSALHDHVMSFNVQMREKHQA